MSTVSRNCRKRAQRLRGGCENTTLPPGSRWQAPWTLRSKRGLPQFTCITRVSPELRGKGPGPVRKCPRDVDWRESVTRAKTAAFPDVRPCEGGSGPALRRTHLPTPTACRRDAGRETYPPHFPPLPMPP